MKRKIKIFLLTSWLFFWSHLCLSIVWQLPATDLSDNTQDAYEPMIATNDSGNAVAVWRRYDGRYIVQTRRYEAGSWSAVEDLSASGQHALGPEVAMDSMGNAIAVWHRSDGSNNIVQTRRYDEATGVWSAITDLSVAGEDASLSKIAMDSTGNAIAVWQRSNGSNDIVQARRYDEATGIWSAVTDLSAAGQDASTPDIAMDSAGNAIAVWRRSDGSNEIIQTKRYDESTGMWSVVTDLSAAGQDAYEPKIAMNSAGNAVAVWRRSNGSNEIIQTRRYDQATDVWSVVEDLSAAGQSSDDPEIAMDSTGNAIAVWRRSNGSNEIVQTRRYDQSTDTWSVVINLSALGQDADNPEIAMDSIGNAIAVWQRSDGSNGIIQAKRYYQTTGIWSAVTDLSVAGQTADNTEISMYGLGNAITVWHRIDNVTENDVIQTVFYSKLPAPSNLATCKKIHRFPAQIDLIHCLTWDAVENATKYKVYLDIGAGTFLVTEPAVSINPFAELHGRCPCTSYTYSVLAVDSDGDDGLPASVTI